MTAHFFELAFTPAVKSAQEANGSRNAYAKREEHSSDADRFTPLEAAFITERDSFYMATVSETGWPYLQHRGGQPGFVKVLDDRSFAIADFRGNRQYVTVGNIVENDRVALFFMDYPQQARLKILARIETVALEKRPDLAASVIDADYRARVERMLLFHLEAFDWNCSQHITPRFTVPQIEQGVAALKQRIVDLQAEIARLSVR